LSHDPRPPSEAVASHAYKLRSATYRDNKYPDGILAIYEARSEVELRRPTGKKRREESVVARFQLQPTTDIIVDGATIRVSELSVTMESASVAVEVGNILMRPARIQRALRHLADAESAVAAFLEAREEAVNVLTRMTTDPRRTILTVESLWSDEKKEPLDAIHASLSTRVGESLDKMIGQLMGSEKDLGPRVTDRLYALAYTVGQVQDDVFCKARSLAEDLAALQELGIETSAGDLKTENLSERIMAMARPSLAALATATASAA
jgi:hypothetical protein